MRQSLPVCGDQVAADRTALAGVRFTQTVRSAVIRPFDGVSIFPATLGGSGLSAAILNDRRAGSAGYFLLVHPRLMAERKPHRPDITALLAAAGDGDATAFDQLYELVYGELRSLARAVRQGRGTETLNTTALVHEAYLHLVPSRDLEWKDRSHFFGVAARAMRQVLSHAARRKLAEKRGGGAIHVELNESAETVSIPIEQIVSLDEALTRLEALSDRQARIVEYRFFAGLSVEETAGMLGLGTATVKRDWRSARAWLTQQLGG